MSRNLLNRITALMLCLCLVLGMVPPAQAAELAITSQPKSAYADAGEKASVSVAATGDNLSYQWYVASRNSTSFSKSSITKSTYSITLSDSNDGRQVYCIVTDGSGASVKSNTVSLNIKETVSITRQPVSASAKAGEKVSATVSASGDGLSYQWYIAAHGSSKFSKSSITKSTYSITLSAANNGRQAYCVVTDRYGNTEKSKTVTFTIKEDFAITSQPKTAYAAAGETVSATVKATGEGLTYQWYIASNGSSSFSKSSIKKPTYSITLSASNNGRQAYCIVTDQNGNTLKTDTVSFIVKEELSITKQPENVYAASGETAVVSLTATGNDLTYTWYFKNATATAFSKTTAFTGPTYSVSMSAARAGRQVYCVVKDRFGNSVTTDTVTLNMKNPLAITVQPKSTAAYAGEQVKATVSATGDGLTYQWYIAARTSSTFSKSSNKTANYRFTLSSSNAGRKAYCVITDKWGNSVTTDTVVFTMKTPLTIDSQPKSVTVANGKKASVSLKATGDELTYTWYWAAAGSEKFSKTSTFTGTSYAITMDESRSGRRVYCVVKDKWGNSVTSDIATLSIAPQLIITQQPVDVWGYEGQVPRTSMKVQGEGLTYAWYIAKAGSSEFTKSSTTVSTYGVKLTATTNGRQVYCVITDKYGQQVQTDTVTLNIAAPFEITRQPVDTKAPVGKKATVSFDVSGDGLTYEWYYANPGSDKFYKTTSFTGNTYAVLMSEARAGRKVYCVITDITGAKLTTDTVTLNLPDPVVITNQPKDVSALPGSTATVTLEAEGEELTYEWYYAAAGSHKFSKTSTFTGPEYSVSMSAARASRKVYCVVTDKWGNTAQTDTVTLYMIPEGLIYTVNESGTHASVTGYEGAEAVITIPPVLGTLPIHSVTIENNQTLTHLTVSSADTALSFYNCAKLQFADIRNVRNLGQFPITAGLFENCYSLKEVILPVAPESCNTAHMFHDCASLYSIDLPQNLTKIGTYMFYGCKKLTDLPIPESVTLVDAHAFVNCSALEWIALPDNCELGVTLFSGCTSLMSVTLPSTLTAIPGSTFTGCTALETVEIPASVTKIGSSSFYNSGISSLTLPSGLISIENHAFNNCDNLTLMVLPENVTLIDYQAFYDCDNLRNVVVPAGVVSLGSDVFTRCDMLTVLCHEGSETETHCIANSVPYEILKPFEITEQPAAHKSVHENADYEVTFTVTGNMMTYEWFVKKAEETEFTASGVTSASFPVTMTGDMDGAQVYCVVTNYNGESLQTDTVTVYSVPEGLKWQAYYDQSYSAYKDYVLVTGYTGTATELVIPDYIDGLPVTSVDGFDNNALLEKITLPNRSFHLGEGAFENCVRLHTVVLPADGYGLMGYTFKGCKNLKNIDISRFSSFNSWEFAGCTSLEEAHFAPDAYWSGAYMFKGCESLKSVTLSLEENEISSSMFEGCTSLTSIVIPDNVTYIDSGAFRNSGLTEVVVPDSVTTLKGDVFSGCVNLTSATLPAELTTIPGYTFKDCVSLSTFTFSPNVRVIDSYAFAGTALTALQLPQYLTSINANAFSDCTGLTGITLPENLYTFTLSAFKNCTALRYVVVPGTETEITSGDWGTTNATTLCRENSPAETYCINNSVPYEILADFEITAQPVAHKSVCENADYEVTFTVTGNMMTYEWFVKKAEETEFVKSDVTSATFPVTMTAEWDGAQVYCVVTNYNEETLTTDTATLYAVPEGLQWQVNDDGNTISITGYEGSSSELTIPAVIDGLPVITIWGGAFEGNTTITSVTLPDSINQIGYRAFTGCSKLTTIVLPASGCLVDSYAFMDCVRLTNVDFDRITSVSAAAFKNCMSLTEAVFASGCVFAENTDNLFENCTSLQRVVLPDGITKIGTEAFRECNALESIQIPDSVTNIKTLAFYRCYALKSIDLPEQLAVLHINVFSESGLESIYIPDGVEIGEYCFDKCTSLTEVRLPADMTAIPNGMFEDCTALTHIDLPDSVTTIGDCAFERSGLTQIDLPADLFSIGARAFSGTALTQVIIPDGTMKIGDSAFAHTNNLRWAIIPASVTTMTGTDIFYESSVTVLCDEGSQAETYCIAESIPYEILQDFEITEQPAAHKSVCENTAYDVTFSVTGNLMTYEWYVKKAGEEEFTKADVTSASFPVTMTAEWDGAQVYCVVTNYNGQTLTTDTATVYSVPEGLQWQVNDDGTAISITGYTGSNGELTIPAVIDGLEVTMIGESAFKGNATLTRVTLPDTCLNLNAYAFNNCVRLTEVVLPEGCAVYGMSTFQDCLRLTNIDVSRISEFHCSELFSGCISLQEAHFAASVDYWDAGLMFSGCTSLESVTLPGNITVIPDRMFEGCNKLQSIDIPETVTSIEFEAFAHCSALTEVYLPDNVTTLGWRVFGYCTSLSSVRLPSGLTEIPHTFFSGCTALTQVDIPETVVTIGEGAFKNSGLTSVTLPANLSAINDYTFANTAIITIEIPDSVLTIGQNAFEDCNVLESMVIPEGVISIGNEAFRACYALRYVVVPESVMTIGNNAFLRYSDVKLTILGAAGSAAETYCASNSIPFEVLQDFEITEQPISKSVCENADYEVTFGVTGNVLTYKWYTLPRDGEAVEFSGVTTATFPLTMTSDMDGLRLYCEVTDYKGDVLCTDEVILTSVPEGLAWQLDEENQTIVITGYTGTASELVIPAVIDGLEVTAIGSEAFKDNLTLTSVTLPETCLTVGSNAFSGCVRLADINLNQVEIIGQEAFLGTASLNQALYLSGCTTVGDAAFMNSGITELVIDSYGTTVGMGAFAGCSALTAADLSGVSHLGEEAFKESGLTEITVPDCCTMDHGVFKGCTALTTATLPADMTVLPPETFFECESLSQINLPEGLIELGAFSLARTGLTAMPYAPNLKVIGEQAFENSAMNSRGIILPASVDTFGANAFWGMYYAAIPGDAVSLADNLFADGDDGVVLLTKGSTTEILCRQMGQRYEYLGTPLEIVTQPVSTAIEEGADYFSAFQVTGNALRYDWTITYFENGEVTRTEKTEEYTYFPDTLPICLSSRNETATATCTITDYLGNSVVTDAITVTVVPEGLAWQVNTDGTAVTITGYTGSNGELTIPAAIDGLPVTAIAAEAFMSSTNLTHVVLPEGLLSIGADAFYGCSNLVSVNIPTTALTIGTYAFAECSSLQSIAFPEGMTKIPDGVCNGCDSLNNITLPEGLTTLGLSSFGQCTSLEEIVFPSTLKSLGQNAFAYCSGLKELNLPSGISNIPTGAFQHCTSLTTLVLPDTVKGFGLYAFQGCTGLQGTIVIPEGVTTISQQAFASCNGVAEFVLPESLNAINQYAFNSCTGLRFMVLPENVSSISTNAFNGCNNLTLLVHEDSFAHTWCDGNNKRHEILQPFALTEQPVSKSVVESADYEVTFGVTGNLMTYEWFVKKAADADFAKSDVTSATFPIIMMAEWDGAQVYCVVTNYNGETLTTDTATLYSVPEGLAWSNDGIAITITGYTGTATELTIPSIIDSLPVTSIEYRAFYECSSLESIAILDSVTSIGAYAFYNCSKLTDITIPDGVTSIGKYAFYGCSLKEVHTPSLRAWLNIEFGDYYSNPLHEAGKLYVAGELLTNAVIPSGVTSIGDNAFYGCSSLTSITIPDSVTSIGDDAFYGCSSLTSITIPDGVTSIEDSTFVGCSSLTSITIPDSVTSIEDSAFYGCSSLTSITIPDSVTSIESYTFYDCSSLTSITIPDGVTSIGDYAFSGCSSLTSITIPDSVTSIGEDAFFGCSKLTSITIPDGVTSIGDFAFAYCSRLTSITIPDSVTSIGDYAFQNCGRLTSITIPDSVTSIESYTFYGCSSLTSITIPDGVTSIGEFAFDSCSSLTSITIPSSVTSIGYESFAYCSSLTSIAIPSSVTYIGDYAFEGCDALTVLGDEGSTAETYCASNSIPFEVLQEFEITEQPVSKSVVENANYEVTFGVTGNLMTYEWFVKKAADADFAKSDVTSASFPITMTGDMDCAQVYCVVTNYNGETLTTDTVTLYSVPEGLAWTVNGEGTAVTVTGYTGTIKELVIPKIIDGLPVTEIGESAFQNNTTVTRVTLPDTVTKLGYMSFMDCARLAYINLESIQYVNSMVFTGCLSLKEAIFPDGCSIPSTSSQFAGCTSLTTVRYPQGVKAIGQTAFRFCSSLTSVELPEGVETIGNLAFDDCTALQEITLPSTLKKIDSYAFSSCTSLESISIPDGVEIGSGAFSACNALHTVRLPADLTKIAGSTFSACTSLTQIDLPDTVVSINMYAFQNSGLTSITLPEGLMTIDINAFYQTPLTHLEIPEGVISIGDFAFYGCNNARYIVVPDSVLTIGEYAFHTHVANLVILCNAGSKAEEHCIQENRPYEILQDFEITSQPADQTAMEGEAFSVSFTATGNLMTYEWFVKAPGAEEFTAAGVKDAVFADTMTLAMDGMQLYCVVTNYNGETLQTDAVTLSATPADYEWDVVADDQGNEGIRITKYLGSSPDVMVPADIADLPVREIGNSAFAGNATLEQVILPVGLTAIGARAFEQCAALSSVTLPEGLVTISGAAFLNCTSLSAITLPASLKTLRNQAFFQCSALTVITIPEGVTVIENNTFAFCSALESVTLPSTLTAIQYEAFYACSKLTALTLPANVSSIGTYAFSESGLTRISLPRGMTAIETGVFNNCFELAEVVIPDTVTSISPNAFAYCSQLTHVNIPNSVTSISSYAFSNCSNLTALVLPDSVTSIDSYAFLYCTSLETVRLSKQLTSIGDYAFEGCSAVTSMILPRSLTTIGNYSLPRFSDFKAYVYADSTGYDFVVNNDNYAYQYEIIANLALKQNLTGSAVCENEICSISFTWTATQPIFQWYRKLATDADFVPLDAPNGSGLSFIMKAELDKAQFYCVVTDMAGDSVTTSTVTVDMMPAGMTYTVYGSYVSVSYSGTATSVTVPDTILGLPVRKVYVTTGNNTLESITLPNTSLALEASAFKNCTALKSVYIPQLGYDSSIMSTDGREVFQGCTALETVTIGSASKLRLGMFENCISLKSVTLPEGLTTIDGYAFHNCSALESITLPSTVTSLGYYAFHGSGLKELILPNNQMTTLGESVLGTSQNLTYLKLPAQLKYIDETFAGCPNLTELYVPATVTRIADKAFTYHGITIYCHENSTAHTYCVENNVDFELVGDGPAIVTQPASTEADRNAEAQVTMEATGAGLTYEWYVKSPAETVFALAKSSVFPTFSLVMTPETHGTQVYCTVTDVIGNTVDSLCVTLTMTEEVLQYKTVVVGGSDIEVTITGVTGKPESIAVPAEIEGYPVTTIGTRAFAENPNLTMLSLPDTLTKISEEAFYGCTALQGVTFPASLTSIGYGAFNGCTSLWSADLPSGLRGIDQYAFKNTALTQVTIPSGVTALKSGTFQGCTQLSSVTFASNSTLTNLDSYVFDDCICLQSITIPTTVRSLGDGAFRNSGLKSANMPYIEYVMRETFAGCLNLTTVSLPSCILLNDYAFYRCSNLSSLNIPELESIGKNAFDGCTALSNFELPGSVNWMGTYCFARTGLTEVTIPTALTAIPAYAFYECASLKTVTIPSTVVSVNDYAFAYCALESVTVRSRDLTFLCETVTENSVFYQSYDSCTFYVYESSTMHDFCTAFDCTYELI